MNFQIILDLFSKILFNIFYLLVLEKNSTKNHTILVLEKEFKILQGPNRKKTEWDFGRAQYEGVP